ncbi:MAG: hypothetical protein IJ468_12345 [Lachnospiraceae bacterium]|nr:hypothetical protein [Lachnospiraceae bacterium]
MIIRKEYRGCIKSGFAQENLEILLADAKAAASRLQETGRLLTACVYRHQNMVFAYLELLDETISVDEILGELSPCLELWPEENGRTPWALMYEIYYHSVPQDPESWVEERKTNTTRIGRIAFLKPEKLFSYTYWHYAIVQEGLLMGDKYQYISLHENILFSYFEEPRHNVNLTGDEDTPSTVIDGWMAVDPESHFDREKAGGNNFIVIDPILIV